MSEIEWVDNPPLQQRRVPQTLAKWVVILTPLMERPGRWAVILRPANPNISSQVACRLRNRHVAIPSGRWEFQSRSADGPTVYARYLGPDE